MLIRKLKLVQLIIVTTELLEIFIVEYIITLYL
jgi:hypothetical protein